MMWAWPFPNRVPWKPDSGNLYFFRCPVEGSDMAFHAVESGVVVSKDGPELAIKGDSGTVCYRGILPDPDIEVESCIERGQRLGRMAFAAVIVRAENGDMVEIGSKVREAWSQVTDCFHRDLPPPPTDPIERKALVQWLLEHPIWTYPVKVGGPLPWLDEPKVEATERVVELGTLDDCTIYTPVYVDPTTETIEEDDARNTAFRVWIETGGWTDISTDPNHPEPQGGWTDFNRHVRCHDYNLDCGGPTLEDALISLAQRVKWFYGEEREPTHPAPPNCGGYFAEEDTAFENYISKCVDAGDRFCAKCGYLIRPRD